MLVFEDMEKLWHSEKNLSEQSREPTKSTHSMALNSGIDPGQHWWKASALTTAPALLSCIEDKTILT